MMAVPTANPAAMYTPNGQQHLFYRDTDGDVWHVFYDPSSNSRHGPEHWVSVAAGNPPAFFSPVAMYTLNTGQQHVFYRGTSTDLWHVFYDPGDNSLHGPEQWA